MRSKRIKDRCTKMQLSKFDTTARLYDQVMIAFAGLLERNKPVSYYVFEMLYWCGIREGELLALKAADFDFNNSTVRINKSYAGVSRRKG